MTDKFINNIKIVYEKNNLNEPFGQINVMEWLKCSKSKATNIIKVLKNAYMIEKVKGFGAGKYKFVDLKKKLNHIYIMRGKWYSAPHLVLIILHISVFLTINNYKYNRYYKCKCFSSDNSNPYSLNSYYSRQHNYHNYLEYKHS